MSTHLQSVLDGGMSRNETHALYESWATNYEPEMNEAGWDTSANVARVVMEITKVGDRIVDFAAGTGCVGQCLRSFGLPLTITMDAVDSSAEMLRVAGEKRIYANTFVSYVGGGATLPVEPESYDVACMAGGFAEGHVPIDGWDFILDAVKPGGHAVCSITQRWLETVPEFFRMDEYIEEVCRRKGAVLKERRVFNKSFAGIGITLWILQKNHLKN